jgi:hypothetical protein
MADRRPEDEERLSTDSSPEGSERFGPGAQSPNGSSASGAPEMFIEADEDTLQDQPSAASTTSTSPEAFVDADDVDAVDGRAGPARTEPVVDSLQTAPGSPESSASAVADNPEMFVDADDLAEQGAEPQIDNATGGPDPADWNVEHGSHQRMEPPSVQESPGSADRGSVIGTAEHQEELDTEVGAGAEGWADRSPEQVVPKPAELDQRDPEQAESDGWLPEVEAEPSRLGQGDVDDPSDEIDSRNRLAQDAATDRERALDAALQRPEVLAAMDAAWDSSDVSDAQLRHEEGGWIIGNQQTGDVRVEPVAPGERAGIQPGFPTLQPDERPLGFFHTHPNPPVDEWGTKWHQGPSGPDRDWSEFRGIPCLVRNASGVEVYRPRSQ